MDDAHAIHSVSKTPTPAEKVEGYQHALAKLAAFFGDNAVDKVGRMATINAVLKLTFPAMHFVGFYTTVEGAPRPTLQIGAYQVGGCRRNPARGWHGLWQTTSKGCGRQPPTGKSSRGVFFSPTCTTFDSAG